MDQLRRLDESVTKRGAAFSMVTGTFSALVLGMGMSCCMVWGGELFTPGILIGALGIVGVSAAYPMYKRITEKERKRLAPEILRLADELLR